MFKKEFEDKIDLNVNLENINDKVSRDFLKYLVFKNKEDISLDTLNKLNESAKIVAANNEHEFVTQSDLIAMKYLEQDEIENFSELFDMCLKNTMFRELNVYLKANIEFKDQATTDFENGSLSSEQKEHAVKLLEWTTNKIVELESTKESVLAGPQLVNSITGVEASEFYESKIAEIITMMKWHNVGFTIIKNA
ncbi:hypothetical protein [[Acholeplasma] multilocale]|uniref:hypothetical protein n=1 Tax=[Acholeplasma] multilocale TaxID=264638 RepID=UPI00047CE539|nr:hypothetical protein [[Acholeplasma] multilocale]